MNGDHGFDAMYLKALSLEKVAKSVCKSLLRLEEIAFGRCSRQQQNGTRGRSLKRDLVVFSFTMNSFAEIG